MKRLLASSLLSVLLLTGLLVLGCDLMALPTVNTNTGTFTTTFTTTIQPGSTAATYLPNFVSVVEKVRPSVVTVETNLAVGTGWIIDSSGIIITNSHVIEDGSYVDVTLHDGREFRAVSFQFDALTDLAVIRIEASGLPAAEVGRSDALRVGEPVAAIGNALGEGISMKGGWVSKLNVDAVVEGQTLYGLIETDAAINEGNSGGPLVNLAGQVIGITNAKLVELGVEGIGYAISIDSAIPFINQLVNQGFVVRPFLGVGNMSNVPGGGVRIGEVIANTPAAAAGLQTADIVLRIDDVTITDANHLYLVIQSKQVGQSIKIDYLRNGQAGTLFATLAERPGT
jgi:serine protease Do